MDADSGTERFHRYIDSFAEASEDIMRGQYPDLRSRPWYDTADFPFAVYLEENYDAIRAELLALDPCGFRQAHNRIDRSGDWDVIFLYERGYRHDENCNVCPVVMTGIDNYSAMRTVAGLAYLSRLRPGAHIRPHSGPTNMRLRCHLGITVPQGDCAIRVGEEIRRWQEGGCIVFDDYFEHEAWNHTKNDRTVLVVDLWHPELSAAEVALLNGLHEYAYSYAGELNRYWAR